MQRKTAAWVNLQARACPDPANFLTTPQLAQRGAALELILLMHGMTADELAAFVGEDAKRWPGLSRRAVHALDRRFVTHPHGKPRRQRCGTKILGF